MSRFFVTGGSGFVGSRLLPALVQRGHAVTALDRTGALRRQFGAETGIQWVIDDLADAARYRDALRGTDAVLHLAALTGRATRDDHLRVNAGGTAVLVDACRQAHVPRFLFVSSIAAGFPDRRGYHYAEAKVLAEQAVRNSGLSFAILRPTMIFGPGSPVLAGLEALALLPVIPVFGSGRTVVQPIHVDDVVRAIVHVVESDHFDNATSDIGGPEPLSIESLLQRIRMARRGAPGRVLRLPAGLVVGPLRAAEAVGLGGLLPVTAGQLSSFRFAGSVTSNPVHQHVAAGARTLAQMLDAQGADDSPLDRECVVFTSYLVGLRPDAYVRRRYAEAHATVPGLEAVDRFEAILIGFARRHPALTKMADAYARIFRPASSLRRKLVLLLAILESTSPTSDEVDRAVGGSPASVALRLVGRGLTAIASLAAGTILLTAARLRYGGRAR